MGCVGIDNIDYWDCDWNNNGNNIGYSCETFNGYNFILVLFFQAVS